MRFRPANISLINGRHYLPRLPLILSSNKKGDQRTLTGHYISLPDWRQLAQKRLGTALLKNRIDLVKK